MLAAAPVAVQPTPWPASSPPHACAVKSGSSAQCFMRPGVLQSASESQTARPFCARHCPLLHLHFTHIGFVHSEPFSQLRPLRSPPLHFFAAPQVLPGHSASLKQNRPALAPATQRRLQPEMPVPP